MQLRVARHTDRLDEVVAFYRDGIGLTEVGGFRGHAGYDGVFLALPAGNTHLEFTTGGPHYAPEPHPESLLVFYLGDHEAVHAIARRLSADPVPAANPYWADHGLTFEDPDGWRVVLVPERWDNRQPVAVEVREHAGSREELRPLFELAEDSSQQLDAYIDAGLVLAACEGGRAIGHLQLVDGEIKNMAVDEPHQRRGVGGALVGAAVARARREGLHALRVATAAADTANLRFYQRLGFRMTGVERDAFTAAHGYPAGLDIDGIELRDRVWLELTLTRAPGSRGFRVSS